MVGNEDGSGSRLELVKDGFLKPTLRVVVIVGALGLLQFLMQFVPGITEPLLSPTVTVGIVVYTVLTVGIFAAIVDYTTHVGEALAGTAHGFPAIERIFQLIGVFVVLVWGYLVLSWLPYFRTNQGAYDLLFLGLGVVWFVWMGYLLATNLGNMVSMVTGVVGSVLGGDAEPEATDEGGAGARRSAGGGSAPGRGRDPEPRVPGSGEQILCPACGAETPADVGSCRSCGAELATGGAGGADDGGRSGAEATRGADRGRSDRGDRARSRGGGGRSDSGRDRGGRDGRRDDAGPGRRECDEGRGGRDEGGRGGRDAGSRTGQNIGDSGRGGRDRVDAGGAGRAGREQDRGADETRTGTERGDGERTHGEDGPSFDEGENGTSVGEGEEASDAEDEDDA